MTEYLKVLIQEFLFGIEPYIIHDFIIAGHRFGDILKKSYFNNTVAEQIYTQVKRYLAKKKDKPIKLSEFFGYFSSTTEFPAFVPRDYLPNEFNLDSRSPNYNKINPTYEALTRLVIPFINSLEALDINKQEVHDYVYLPNQDKPNDGFSFRTQKNNLKKNHNKDFLSIKVPIKPSAPYPSDFIYDLPRELNVTNNDTSIPSAPYPSDFINHPPRPIPKPNFKNKYNNKQKNIDYTPIEDSDLNFPMNSENKSKIFYNLMAKFHIICHEELIDKTFVAPPNDKSATTAEYFKNLNIKLQRILFNQNDALSQGIMDISRISFHYAYMLEKMRLLKENPSAINKKELLSHNEQLIYELTNYLERLDTLKYIVPQKYKTSYDILRPENIEHTYQSYDFVIGVAISDGYKFRKQIMESNYAKTSATIKNRFKLLYFLLDITETLSLNLNFSRSENDYIYKLNALLDKIKEELAKSPKNDSLSRVIENFRLLNDNLAFLTCQINDLNMKANKLDPNLNNSSFINSYRKTIRQLKQCRSELNYLEGVIDKNTLASYKLLVDKSITALENKKNVLKENDLSGQKDKDLIISHKL